MRGEDKIKLVQIIADSDFSGGPVHVLGLLENIDKEKFDTHLICPRGTLMERAESIRGVTVHPVLMRSKFDLKAFSKIKKILGEIQTESDPFGRGRLRFIPSIDGIKIIILKTASMNICKRRY